jgi:hypothetical protein
MPAVALSPLDQRPQYQGHHEEGSGYIERQGEKRSGEGPNHQIRQRRKGCEGRKKPDDHRIVRVQDQRNYVIIVTDYTLRYRIGATVITTSKNIRIEKKGMGKMAGRLLQPKGG